MAKIFGKLEKAGAEYLAADPTGSGLFKGRFWFNETDGVWRYYDGSAKHEFADLDTAQTFINKTLTSPQIDTPTIDTPSIDGAMSLEELLSTPTNPSAGRVKFYRRDGLLYTLDENGNEVPVGSGSGSGIGQTNFLDAKNSTFDFEDTDFSVYNDGAATPTDLTGGTPSGNLSVSLTTVVGEVLAGERSLKLSKNANSALGEGISALSTLIDLDDRGKKFKLKFSKKTLDSNYESGDLKIYAYDVTNSAFLDIESDYDQDVLNSDNPQEYFVQTQATTEEIRVGFHVATSNALAYDLVFDKILIGPDEFSITTSYNRTETIDVTGSGDFTGGEILVNRVENIVSITINSPITFSSNTAPSSATGLLPEWATPNVDVFNAYLQNSNEVKTISAQSDGRVLFFFHNWSGTPQAETSSDPGCISYAVEDDVQNSVQGLVRNSQLQFEEKILAATVSASPNTNVIQFDNLKVGSRFLVTTQVRYTLGTAEDIESAFYNSDSTFNNTTLVYDADQELFSGNPGERKNQSFSFVFTAETPFLTYRTGAIAQGDIVGGGGKDGTFIQIHEIPFSQTALIQLNKKAVIRDEKSPGTQGGTFTGGAWQTRDLNTLEDPFGIVVSLSSNQITLSPGRYFLRGSAPAFNYVGNHACRFHNVDTNITAITGTMESSFSGTNASNRSHLVGEFFIAQETTFELQHRGQVTRSTDGFGNAGIFVLAEIYSELEIIKVE